MGILRITTMGSFGSSERSFKAQESGHAVAVDEAIKFLKGLADTSRVMDRKLRAEGLAPDDSFAKADQCGLLDDSVAPVPPENVSKDIA